VFKVPQILEYVGGWAECVLLLFYYYLHFSIFISIFCYFLFFCYTYFCVVDTVNFFALNFSFFKFSTTLIKSKIFLIYREIQSGAVAKSYMRKGFLIYEEMHKYFPIYEEAVSHI
jgi:hypothetical protein